MGSAFSTKPVMLSSYAEMEDTVGNEEWERINQPEVRKRVQNRLSQRRHSEYLKASRSLLTPHHSLNATLKERNFASSVSP